MKNKIFQNNWILIDTETTGIKKPIYVVEIAAQKMEGWKPVGEPFRRIINHGCEIPAEASRVNGYTAEILERDGCSPEDVYEEFSEYVGSLPICAYNLAYDWDKVLLPEWRRLSIAPIGQRGFCAYLLAQRLLDPVPAGNCKLQTLRQYYRLPERGAHTALGDVETVADLLENVLEPIAKSREIESWEDILTFTEEEWFPSRIPFGKFKGRAYYEAHNEPELRSWLEWLSSSTNQRSSSMGNWYLSQLETSKNTPEPPLVHIPAKSQDGSDNSNDLVLYGHLEAEHYNRLIEVSRNRLAEYETEHTLVKSRIDSVNATLYSELCDTYKRRDHISLVIQYRHLFIERLLSEGEDAAEETTEEFEEQAEANEQEYKSTADSLEGKVELDGDQQKSLKKLWKKLVRMFHPDQYDNDPEKRKTYEMLTQAINQARDTGDISLLEQIASNPEGFIRMQGWKSVNLDDSSNLDELRSLYELLQKNILEVIEAINDLKTSPDHELYELAKQDDSLIERVANTQKAQVEEQIQTLEEEATELQQQMEELTGAAPTI